MGKSIKSVVKLVTAPIKAMYDPVGAFKDVFGGVQGVFAGLTGAAKISGGPSSEPSSQTVRSSKAPVRFILGRASTGGVLAWVQEQSGDQTSGEWIHIVYVLSEGAIAGVDEIYVDERPLSDLGENATSEVIIDPTQVNAFLLANCPDWRQEQIGRGLSFVRLSFKYDAEKFPSGIPDVRFVVRGRSDIYDPRNGNSGYSANTALLILWYLRNRCAIPDDEIIFQSFASAANICDETVIGPDGKMSPRYFAGAVIGADEKRNTVLDNLLSACAGTLIRVGGRWSLQVGAYYGPANFTINEDMVIGTVEGTTEVSNSDAINTMRGTFVDPAQAWAETDYPEVAIQDWIATDGGELAESQSFAYVTDAYLAQRLANISLRRRRSGGSLSVPLNFNGYNCRPGRAVKVDLPSLNILGEFMVTEWTMGAADACKVTLKPYEQAFFDDAVGQPYDPLGFINLPVGGLAAVTGLAWTASSVAEIIQGVLSWVSPAQTVLSYTVTIRKGTEVVQSLKVGGEAASCNINGLASGTYTMSVVAFGPGTRSGEASINVNVGGPPVPESCDYFASVDSITLVPVNRQNSLNGGTYEYFHATNPQAPIADAMYLGQGLTFTHTGLAFAKQYFYYVRSANAYGKSDFLYVAAATSDDPTQMLEVIKGEILESHLGQQLTEKIDLIDGNGPGSVNERVGAAKTELAQQISEANNALATTKGNLEQQITAVSADVAAAKTDLQQQIANVSALAGSLPYRKDKAYSVGQSALGADGKLYQASKAVPLNTPPPNATYWTDVGQAVVTAAGTAARVQTVETKVESLEGTTSAQAQQITGLQSSLTTTNGNVSAAQQAAQDAATLAGGKGKVIVQSAAPAVADRLAQNLWIDTTGNANTPKRWNGSAWVAVTDKVATDAAAAAQSALSQVALKADATVVSNLSTRVSDAEGKLSSQASRMDGMQTSIDGKASSQALQQVTSRVTATEQKDAAQDLQLSSQSQALTSLTDSVSKKAEASTVQSLSNKVDQHGQDLAAQGQSLVSINAALPNAGGENLVYNPSFDKPDPATPTVADGWWYDSSGTSVTRAPSLVASTLATGFAQRLDVGGLTSSTWARIYGRANRRFKVVPGKTYTASLYMRGTAGLRILPQVYGVNEAGSSSGSWAGARVDAGEEWTRLSVTFTPDANTSVVYPAFVVYGGASAPAGFIEGDQYQIEEGTLATGWRDNGQVNSGNQAATATAVEALNAKVTQQGSDLASVSSKTTSLENGLTTTNGNVATAQQAAQAAADAAGAKGKVLYQSAAPAVADRLAQNLWIDTTGNANTPKRWTGTTWAAVTDKVAADAAAAAQSALSQVALKADSSALQTLGSTVSQQGQQITADGQAITRIDASLNQVKSDTASNALATSALTGRVGATEAGLTSVSGQLTEVSNSIGNVGGENLVYNSSFEEEDPGTPGIGNGWWYDGSAGTRVPSLVPSTVAPGIAQRLDITGLSPSTWARVYVKQSMRFKVTPGKTYTASVYVRGTPGLRVLAQVYNLNSAGSNTASWGSVRQDATLEGARLVVTFVASSDTVLLYPSVVVYGGASVTGGFIEADQYQVEEGSRATGWRDNGQVIAASNSATSKAVDSLTSTVNQQGANLSSVSGRTTSLENSLTITNGNVTSAQQAAQAAATAAGAKGEVIYGASAPAADKRLAQNLWIDTTNNANTPKRWNGTAWAAVTDKVATDAAAAAQSALTQVALKADASALQTLGSTVSQQGATLSSQATSITQIKASMGQQPDNLILRGVFEDGVSDPWTAGPVIVAVSAHPSASKAVAFYGNSFCGLERNVLTKGGEQFDLSADIFAGYMSSGQTARLQMQFFDKAGASISYLDAFSVPPGLGSFKAYTGRITAPAGAVSARFVTRLEPSDGSGRALWCNIVARRVSEAEAATANAVSSVTSTVNQQGEKLTAETQRIDVLSASVGSAQAAIQNEITARTNADSALSQQIQTTQSSLGDTNASVQRVSSTLTQLNGVANASEVVKVQMTANGIRHVAGFGLSIDNSKGAVQSTFAILAGRFAILNPSGDAISSPFAVYGNQTFISDAYIRDASITNAKIANAAITAAKIGEAEVDTLRIRGNAVTIPVGAFAGSNTVSVTVTLDGNYAVFLQGSLTQVYFSDITMTRNGTLLWMERPRESTLASRGVMDYPGPGTHTYTLSSNHAGNTNGASILAVVCKR